MMVNLTPIIRCPSTKELSKGYVRFIRIKDSKVCTRVFIFPFSAKPWQQPFSSGCKSTPNLDMRNEKNTTKMQEFNQ